MFENVKPTNDVEYARIGETGDNCNTGHVVTGDPTPRENDLRWLF